jgi:hypothetical protein
VSQAVFTTAINLPKVDGVPLKKLNRELQIAIYDVLDEYIIDYQTVAIGFATEDDPNAPFNNGKLPGFRSTDPDTSRKGAIDVYPRAGSYRYKALIEIAKAGDQGLTYDQIERKTGIKSVWKRLSELRDGDWIYEAGERLVQATGSMATIWKITARAERHIETKEKAGVIQ